MTVTLALKKRRSESVDMEVRMHSLVLAPLVMLFTAHMVLTQTLETSQFAARTRLIPIRTATVSDQQFLNGDDRGKDETIAGQLRIAQGRGRLPTVVLVHGSSGMGSNIEFWSREFNSIGISTFALDGLTGRGLTNATPSLGRLNLILDSYRALKILADHPRVDPTRIALMGFSRGGQTALYASLARFHEMWNKSGIEFATYIPFYPRCSTTYQTDTAVANVPIRIFHGTADDANPVGPCRAYVERLKAAGRDVVLTEYDNAHHAFDFPTLSATPVLLQDAKNIAWCTLREEPGGRLINASTGQPPTSSDDCVRAGFHVGYDHMATESAKRSVVEFLTDLFELQ